jgi:hypothetical protein
LPCDLSRWFLGKGLKSLRDQKDPEKEPGPWGSFFYFPMTAVPSQKTMSPTGVFIVEWGGLFHFSFFGAEFWVLGLGGALREYANSATAVEFESHTKSRFECHRDREGKYAARWL